MCLAVCTRCDLEKLAFQLAASVTSRAMAGVRCLGADGETRDHIVSQRGVLERVQNTDGTTLQVARTLSTYMTQESESNDLVTVGRYDSKNRNITESEYQRKGGLKCL